MNTMDHPDFNVEKFAERFAKANFPRMFEFELINNQQNEEYLVADEVTCKGRGRDIRDFIVKP
ncbi:hypothetical protein VXQ23_02145 [Acinetobacter variabilis]|uniref:hypothetical protein n=1 Tax=Acinetobacter variabilis TaxID=70346 RepID=UPI003A8C5046